MDKLSKIRVFCILSICFFSLRTDFTICMRKYIQGDELEKLEKDINIFCEKKITKKEKTRENLTALCQQYFDLAQSILRISCDNTNRSGFLSYDIENENQEGKILLFRRIIFSMRSKFRLGYFYKVQVPAKNTVDDKIENALYHGFVELLYDEYLLVAQSVVTNVGNYNANTKLAILGYITHKIYKLFKHYRNYRKKDYSVGEIKFLLYESDVLDYQFVQISKLITRLGNGFALGRSIFEKEIAAFVQTAADYKKNADTKDISTKELCAAIAPDFATKFLVVHNFFSKAKQKERINKKALYTLAQLEGLKITNMVVPKETQMSDFYVYIMSKITIKQVMTQKKNKVFLVKLPCLQQRGGTCQIHMVVNSYIFAKNDDLLTIINELNNAQDCVNQIENCYIACNKSLPELIKQAESLFGCCRQQEMKNQDALSEDILSGRLSVRLSGNEKSEGECGDYENDYGENGDGESCEEDKDSEAYINYITVIDNAVYGDIESPKIGMDSEVFAIYNEMGQDGEYHCIATRIEKSNSNTVDGHSTLVVFYADSEHIITNLYDERLFVNLVQKLGY